MTERISTPDERIVLTCSVRHVGPPWAGRSAGEDLLFLPPLTESRVELIASTQVSTATGVRLASEATPISVRWWLSEGQPASYMLNVYATGEAIDLGRFIDINSSDNARTDARFDFGQWQFESRWA